MDDTAITIEKFTAPTPEFLALCEALDADLNKHAGGEKNRAVYIPHNKVDAIKDVFVAFAGQAPVACAAYKRWDAHTAEAKRVYVQPQHRQQGLARRLMLALEEDARQQGLRRLVLETGWDMTAAVALYHGLGYRAIENYEPYVGLAASVCMEKLL